MCLGLAAPTLFEWASPFDFVVWIVIGFEILIVRAFATMHACLGRLCVFPRVPRELTNRRANEQCAVAIYAVEYRADNDCFATNPLERLWDTMYYSMTILLGVADKQPTRGDSKEDSRTKLRCKGASRTIPEKAAAAVLEPSSWSVTTLRSRLKRDPESTLASLERAGRKKMRLKQLIVFGSDFRGWV